MSPPLTTPVGIWGGFPQFFMEATEAMSGVDVGRLEVEDKDLPGSPNWAARFTILEGDPDGHFTIRTDPKTNEGVLSVVKVSGAQLLQQGYHSPQALGTFGPSAHPQKGAEGGDGAKRMGNAGTAGSDHTDHRAQGHPHKPVCYLQCVPLCVRIMCEYRLYPHQPDKKPEKQ